jgi:DNA polymerase bacteriophage-type
MDVHALRYGDQVPAGAGLATCLSDCDFETYSEAGFIWNAQERKWENPEGIAPNKKKGLGVIGLHNYVTHPSFEVLCFWYDLKDGLGRRFWRPDMPPPLDLFAHVQAGKFLEAWNVSFERKVWNYYLRPKMGWPEIKDSQWRCAMAKSRQQAYPGGLADAAPAIGSPELKDPAGEKLINKLTVPRKPTKKNPDRRLTPMTAAEDFARFYAYGEQDIVTEYNASIRVPDLSPRELNIWRVDQRINDRGMYMDRPGIENMIAIVEQATDRHNFELRGTTNGAVETSSKVADTLRWLAKQGVHLEDLDEETVETELTEKQHAPAVKRVLEIRQLLSFGSVKKLYAMKYQTGNDGRLRDQYAYHAAHTSLWNGQNVQPANLYKGKLDKPEKVEAALAAIASRSLDYVEALHGNGMETIADCLRSMIIAAPGCDLIGADYSAIQAVVLACLAGEAWRIKVFQTHGKIYEASIAEMTGTPLEVILGHKKLHGAHHPLRALGKLAELSAGFASWIGGWKKFGAGDYYENDAAIKQAILSWRRASPAIVEFWGGQTRNKFGRDLNGNRANEYPELYGLEGAAIRAVLNPGRHGQVGECHSHNGVRYQMYKDALYCQPPTNGDPLIYHEPRLEPSRREYASPWEVELSYMGWNSNQTKGRGGWVRMKLYGGVQTQNVVAKVSREVQADTLVRLDDSGLYLPVMHTHDEQITEVPEGMGSSEEYLTIANDIPHWARFANGTRWPIKAPGAERTKRYGKWE